MQPLKSSDPKICFKKIALGSQNVNASGFRVNDQYQWSVLLNFQKVQDTTASLSKNLNERRKKKYFALNTAITYTLIKNILDKSY